MIVVIADDLTGAAELGGIGMQHNLKTAITTNLHNLSETELLADLLVIDLDTRSKSQQEAEMVIEKICNQLLSLQPAFIFKKIDSVLRGHILPEVKTQMKLLSYQRALIVSANPALERTIVNGKYLFKGKPIHESSFAQDPEFPITSSLISDMLRAKEDIVHVLKTGDALPENGLIVGEVQTGSHLTTWAKRLAPDTIAVGSAGFFEAILRELNFAPTTINNAKHFFQPFLYVCGTTFQKSRDAIKREKERGGPVSYFPVELIENEQPSDEQYNKWVNEINSLIQQHSKAIIAIDPQTTTGASAFMLRESMAIAVAKVLHQSNIHDIFLEGGSSAAAILRRSGITNFHPVEQLAPGVIRMQDNSRKDLFFTLKPGSYDWPPDIPFFTS